MHRYRGRAGAALLAFVLVACGDSAPGGETASPPPPSPTEGGAALPEGWVRLVLEDEGFSMGAPAAWTDISADTLADSGVFEEIGNSDPDLAALMQQVTSAIESGSIALFVFDPGELTQETGFAANVNVLFNARGATTSATDLAAQGKAEIEAANITSGPVEATTTDLPVGETAVLRYEWSVPAPSGASHDVAVTQYLVRQGRDVLVVSMTSLAAHADEYTIIWEQMADTFELLGG